MASIETSSWPEPPKGLARTLHSSDRDLALQDYLALQEEHECLRQHLNSLRKFQASEPAGLGSSASHNPASSPTQAVYPPSESSSRHSRSSSRGHSQGQRRRSSGTPVAPRPLSCLVSSASLETVMDESTIAEVAAEEARLSYVNEGIKRALTELLNCATVRGDRAFRTWVQCRLMSTEKELRTGRRRRSAPEFCMPS